MSGCFVELITPSILALCTYDMIFEARLTKAKGLEDLDCRSKGQLLKPSFVQMGFLTFSTPLRLSLFPL